MKKTITLILILALLLSGCARKQTDDEAEILPTEQKTEAPPQTNEPPPPKAPQSVPVTAPEPQVTAPEKTEPITPPVEDAPVTVPDYKSFICRTSKKLKWKQVRFTNDADVTLQFEIPDDWQLVKTDADYEILRDNKQIGILSQSKPHQPTAFYDLSTEYYNDRRVFKSYQVNWYHTDDGNKVARVFEFITNDGKKAVQLYLCVNYIELNDSAKAYVENSALTVPKPKEEKPFPKTSDSNGSKKILLLGNSFINSSRVNMFLHDMLRNTDYQLITVARGNAQVYTFSQDVTICEQIKNGEYSYVFVGSFYTEESLPAIKILLECAKQSGTNIIAFPAHNEGDHVFSAAMDTNEELILLNWKGEIDSLIDSGIDKWTFCVDDNYQHSTVYAGYVGAHMIYRSLFNKIPPYLVSAPLSQAQVDGILGDYSKSIHPPEPPAQTAFDGVEYKIS